ncbi:outer membrane protein/peptidoglycan-associated (lipo)protein [Terriglobus roseus DSM 18391]|uniref:Peptidoglycan-associated lipoprotein n=1 Tax=Terriglobus roseus (strain DSM 18391 / NRRL B-41598 / KBS 63) TaxID=926566 RepID=I3ZH92_TERRK|nr:OmpA family protein [Terriglobus roseus]AFL88269.1 outer membrane protein/peptidoglycan-associated (lipo)protein [Terriglobus roseus DSM 18391]AFL88610.1 outer membrane protein/peptidoglycan-associated (lipo)protein [Terriglobus roseus DSM 18391]
MTLHKLRTNTLLTIAAASMVLLSGCHKKVSAPPPYTAPAAVDTAIAPTAVLTADPSAIDLGQSVVLNWRTTGATSVTIDGIGPVNLSGTQNVTPSNSTNFHLVAKGDGGVAEANVRVTVRVPAPPTADLGTQNDLGSDAAFHAAVQDVFFDYDSYDLRADAQTNATQAASYLSQHPAIKITIGGYCDERGSAEYNLALGENRANAAKTALVNAGIATNRIRVISFGKEKQFCTEQNESCWQQNRRAQFNIDR